MTKIYKEKAPGLNLKLRKFYPEIKFKTQMI
jgi:hypothetical protein